MVADKGFDADALRARVTLLADVRASHGGSRPFSRPLYRRRHRIENFFFRIKRHRRISTRYDKLASTFFAFVQLAAVLDWLRN